MRYEFIDKSLFFPDEKILVIGDLHIGYEEALNKAGVMIPRTQFRRMMDDLQSIFLEISKLKNFDDHQEPHEKNVPETGKLKEIIILGDLKHEFGTISKQEWDETLMVLDFLSKNSEKIILVKGNHDTILGPIADRRGIEVLDFYVYEDFLFIHGNKEIEEIENAKIGTIVLGHRHPAVVISDDYKKEKYKTFLVGEFKGKRFIILPSFFPFIEGSDVIGDEEYLFIPRKDLEKAEAYVVGDKVYRFGKVKDII